MVQRNNSVSLSSLPEPRFWGAGRRIEGRISGKPRPCLTPLPLVREPAPVCLKPGVVPDGTEVPVESHIRCIRDRVRARAPAAFPQRPCPRNASHPMLTKPMHSLDHPQENLQ